MKNKLFWGWSFGKELHMNVTVIVERKDVTDI